MRFMMTSCIIILLTRRTFSFTILSSACFDHSSETSLRIVTISNLSVYFSYLVSCTLQVGGTVLNLTLNCVSNFHSMCNHVFQICLCEIKKKKSSIMLPSRDLYKCFFCILGLNNSPVNISSQSSRCMYIRHICVCLIC